MSLPTVSVVIPTWNRTSFIEEAIDSVLSQTYRGPIELVVVDDGSDEPVSDRLGSRYPDVRFIRTPHCGLASARRTGASMTSGEFVAYHDDDDLWMPDKLARQIDFLQKNPDAEMVWCDLTYFWPGKRDSAPRYARLPWLARATCRPASGEGVIHPRNSLVNTLMLEIPPYAQSMVFRRPFLGAIGGWDARRSIMAENYPPAYHATRNGVVGRICDPLVRIRRGHQQATSHLEVCRIEEARDLIRWVDELPEQEQLIVLPLLARRLAARTWRNLRTGSMVDAATTGSLATWAALRHPLLTLRRPWLRQPELVLASS